MRIDGIMVCPIVVSIMATVGMMWVVPMVMVVRCHAAVMGMTSGVICMSVSDMMYPSAMRVVCSMIMLVHTLAR